MDFNFIELVNLFITITLLLMLFRKRDAITLLLVLILSGTFHFSFAAMALIFDDKSQLLIDMHNRGGGMLATISTMILLGVVSCLLVKRIFEAHSAIDLILKKKALIILLVMVALLSGYLINYRQGDFLQLKNIVSIEVMFSLIAIGYFALIGVSSIKITEIRKVALVGVLALGFINAIAIFELFSGHAWAVFLDSSGMMVYRASSVLFNPNLYAFWASFVYLAYAYAYTMQSDKDNQFIFIVGMVLAATAIYVSGSRSAGYLLLGTLLISYFLAKEQRRCLPAIIFPSTILAIYACGVWLMSGITQVAILGERFLTMPRYLFYYLLKNGGIPKEVIISIEGRLNGSGSDNGWLVLYQDAGIFGLGAVLFACGLLVWRGACAYQMRPNTASAYTLGLLMYCIGTGFVMRMQIFPVWLFIGLAIIINMVYWETTLREKDKKLICGY